MEEEIDELRLARALARWAALRAGCDPREFLGLAWEALSEAAKKFDPKRSSRLRWLQAAGWKRLLDALRKECGRPESLRRLFLDRLRCDTELLLTCAGMDGRSPPLEVEARELVDRMKAALRRLSSRERRVIRMRFFEHRSCADTAERMGLSVGAVWHHQHRAILRLREELRKTA